MSKRFKHRNKAVVAGLATAAALAGGVGVAAASGPSVPPDSKAPSAQAEGAEQAEGTTEQPEGTEQQEPSLNGSVAATEVPGETEQQEETRLADDAKVSKQQAETAALQAVPGTVTAAELGNENGSLIWEVDVRQPDGSTVEVKVDAGDGKVLAQEADDEGADGTSESEGGEQDEAGEAATTG